MIEDRKWLPVVGYEGIYEVRPGTDGGAVRRVSSMARTYAGRELKGFDSQGYARVVLSKPDCKPRYVRIHTLILEAFVGPKPANCEACHRGDNRMNNTIGNLYWGSRSDNLNDMVRNGRHRSDSSHAVRARVQNAKGCSFNKSSGKWVAYIRHKGKRIHLGSFECETDAKAARAKAVENLVLSEKD